MASVSSLFKFAFAVIVCMAVAAPLAEAAITCGNVEKGLAPCVSYLKGSGTVTPACCNGVRTLKGMAKTPTDRRTACGCLKSAASSISGIKLPNAAALPGKCGVSIAYAISPKTDCSKVN